MLHSLLCKALSSHLDLEMPMYVHLICKDIERQYNCIPQSTAVDSLNINECQEATRNSFGFAID